jgi:hypothetical protein
VQSLSSFAADGPEVASNNPKQAVSIRAVASRPTALLQNQDRQSMVRTTGFLRGYVRGATLPRTWE